MHQIEFETQIENGIIRIPDVHQQALGDTTQVKVVLLQPEAPAEPEEDFITELLNHPLEIEDFIPTSRDQLHER